MDGIDFSYEVIKFELIMLLSLNAVIYPESPLRSLKLRKLFLLIPALQSILWVEVSVEAIY